MNVRLTDLRSAIGTLNATGACGFEGFIQVVLSNLTGIPFRLAASGLQGGMDGDAAFRSDAVSFEAKRYSKEIPRNEVLTKIVDIARNKDAADRLWVLGATTRISAQLAFAVREAGDQNAISTLILDWSSDPLPLLAVAAVAADGPAIDFLTTHCVPKRDRKELAKTFKDISEHPNFGNLLKKLRSNLNVSTLAMARSIEVNSAWRVVCFGSENTTRERLGQALAVNAQSELPPLRASLREQVKECLQAGQCIVLTGGEGRGKSWLAAQICCDHEGLALFASAEQLDGVAPNDLDNYLIDLLIKQTGDVSDEAIRLRWRHRLATWQSHQPASSLLVVIDGINQRQSLRWDRLLNGLQDRLQSIGGRLVVTVRTLFWQKTVAPGLTFRPKQIDVPEWSSDERNQLLLHYGIKLDWLDDATLQTLRNPRLLGVAVATLPHRDSVAWKGLTTDRLLMEHLRASQRDNFEEETLIELTERLSTHAKEVLERVRESSNEPPQYFESDSTAVIETRFFRSLPGPGGTYELRDEGLTLALGYTLVDQLWQARRSGLDLRERMTHIIDPIYAMDRTVDVMFAALMVCALDHIRFHETIFVALLDAFSNLQNIDDQRFEEFVEIVKTQPSELFGTLHVFTLERGRRLNQDWFIHAAFDIAATDEGWHVAEAAIHQWLHCYNKDAVDQANRYPKHNEDEDTKRLQRTQREIQDVLSSLLPFERNLLEQMTEVSGEVDSLFTLALQLLAGRPLAGFASSFVALGLGFSLDRGVFSARKSFNQLTTFNRVDREATKGAFMKVIEPLQSPDTKPAGLWTIVRMLLATGDEAAADKASTIAEQLSKDWHHWEPPSPYKWRQSRVADPEAIRPSDMEEGLQHFRALNQDRIMKAMGQSSEDNDYQDFLPVACRFEPEVAVDKTRQILLGLLARTGTPLRQLIFNGLVHHPLMTRDVAIQLIVRVTDTDMVQTLPEREQDTLRMFLFNYVVPLLTQAEQLDCLTDRSFGSGYLLNVIPSLKPQSVEDIIDALQEALYANDEDAAYGVLVAARYGETPITSKLESLILSCRSAESSTLRTLSFELAIYRNLKALRELHVQSDWSASKTNTSTYESWFGSILLAEACAKKELAFDEMVKRLSPATWFAAAERVGEAMIKPLPEHFLRRLQAAIGATKNLTPPAVDFALSTDELAPYPFLSVKETDRDDGRFPRTKTPKVFGINEGFDVKQDRIRAISDAFFEGLKGSDALLLFEHVSIDDLRLLVHADPILLPQILEILEQASSSELRWLKNVAFAIANLISKDTPERAAALFHQALKTQGFVTYVLGDDLTLEHKAIWSSAPSEALNTLWRQRLLQSGSDEELAREVVAAERFGAATFIRAFVKEHADSPSTLDQAYAISVAGFSMQSGQFVGCIEDHLDDKGISGHAAKNAKAAHETAQWAEKWVNDMCAAQSPEEFWRCLIISKTCMDARMCTKPKLGTRWAHYAPLFRQIRKSAIEEQNKTRKKTLLGLEVPDKIFISGW